MQQNYFYNFKPSFWKFRDSVNPTLNEKIPLSIKITQKNWQDIGSINFGKISQIGILTIHLSFIAA